MIRKAPISMIMTEQVITLKKNDSLEKAEMLFKRHHIRHIPIISDHVVVGMLSHTDIFRLNFNDLGIDEANNADTFVHNVFKVEHVMRRKLISVSSSNSIKEVAQIFAAREFHALPVIDHNQLVGIVTTTDIIKYLLNQL